MSRLLLGHDADTCFRFQIGGIVAEQCPFMKLTWEYTRRTVPSAVMWTLDNEMILEALSVWAVQIMLCSLVMKQFLLLIF